MLSLPQAQPQLMAIAASAFKVIATTLDTAPPLISPVILRTITERFSGTTMALLVAKCILGFPDDSDFHRFRGIDLDNGSRGPEYFFKSMWLEKYCLHFHVLRCDTTYSKLHLRQFDQITALNTSHRRMCTESRLRLWPHSNREPTDHIHNILRTRFNPTLKRPWVPFASLSVGYLNHTNFHSHLTIFAIYSTGGSNTFPRASTGFWMVKHARIQATLIQMVPLAICWPGLTRNQMSC